MKFILLMLLSAGIMSKTCKNRSKTTVETAGIPPCIQQRIDSIQKQPRWNPPAEVSEYRYNGKRVFLFSSDCCDFYNTAVDSACNYVCAPSGGITGQGDGKCPDFTKTAQFTRLVWKDKR